jgi:hypothetical protein
VSRRRKGSGGRPARLRLPGDPRRIDWQAVEWARIDHCLARFDPGSLAVLLAAAADSPGGGHRLPSLTILWLRCLASPPAGRQAASVKDLPRLLSAARGATPQLRALEDCWSADPRLMVRFPVSGQRFRVHPGSHTDPVLTLRPVIATAQAIDDFALERHGFRLTDLLEVALRYSEYRIGALASAWPAGRLDRNRDDPADEELRARVQRIARTPVTISDAEVAAAVSVIADPSQWTAACEHPARAAAAWKWATRQAAELTMDLTPGAERLGPVLAAASQGRDWPVPAALVVSGVATAAVVLAREAADDQESARRMEEVIVRRALSVFGHPVVAALQQAGTEEEAADVPVLGAPVAVTVPASRHAFAVGFASGLDTRSLVRSLRDATAAVDGMTLAMIGDADDRFDPTGSVFRVVVYGGPVPAPAPDRPGTVWVHVDHLITAAMDADQAATGETIGRELLWQFLDELASMPGVAELSAWEFADIWELWRERGVLNPSGLEGITLHPVAVPDQESWERSAAWEPLETVLTCAGMPPSWEWSFARLNEPGQATVGQRGNVFLLLADPALIVHAELDNQLATIAIDPAFTVGVAEGIRQTAHANPGVAAVMSMTNDAPLVCRLRLEPQHSPGASPDVVGCRLAAATGPPPVVALIFGADWLELLAENPADGHGVLGRALAEGLRQALHLPAETCEAFMAAWSQAVPVAALRRAETTLPPAFQGRDQLPRSLATAARARRAIAAGIVASDVPRPAIYTGQGATGLCTDVILPVADHAMATAIADWSPATVLAVARCLNDAHADRARRAGELALALAAPWGPDWQAFALEAPEPATITRPLELLLETLLAKSGTGTVDADAFEIAEAADLADAAISASLYLAATRHRLHELAVAIRADGQWAITDTAPEKPATASIDIGAYLQADRADRLRLRPQPLTGVPVKFTPGMPSERQDFALLRDLPVPGSLLNADAVMKRALGTGIDGFRAVLGTAVTWTPNADDISEASRDQLRDAAITWSSLPPSEIDAALALLTLTPAQLREEGLPYWEQERRTYRLATRPLICPDGDRLILIPHRIAATQETYVGYLLNGRLPWPPTAVPRAVADAFNNFRNRANRELERQVLQTLNSLGIPHKGNIKPHQAAQSGLRITGEIDALAADPARSRLWVCEVKDVSVTASPRTIADRVRKFTEPDGYNNQLLRSLGEIQADPGAAARFLRVPDQDRSWQVLPLMITRFIEPAAFTRNPAVTFVTAEDLAAILQADT